MAKGQVKLSTFTTDNFDKERGFLTITLWYFVNALIVKASWNPFTKLRVAILRLFGAKIGKGLVMKNNVNIKFPWKLKIGDNCWIGENVWIDNLDHVTLKNDVCLSQGALLLTGNHDYRLSDFPYRNAPIVIESGAWIGAKTVVCPGVHVGSHAILSVGSVASQNMEEYMIYRGNPAVPVRERIIK